MKSRRSVVLVALVAMTLAGPLAPYAQDFIPEPDIIYYGQAPSGEVVQVERGSGQPIGTALLANDTADANGYAVRVKLVAPVTTPVPTPPDGKAYINNQATVFVNNVAQGRVILDERGAIYQLNFPSPARTASPLAVLTPLRVVPAVPTPPSCGSVTCTPSATPTVTATPTQTRTPTITATPTATSTAAIVAGSVSLEGRPPTPDPKWSVPLRVSVTVAGQMTPLAQYTPTTDQNGQFQIAGIDPGAYEIRVKNPKTLQVKKDVTLTSGVNSISFGTLKAGDANDDNVVNLIDFSILRTTFGLAVGQAGYDARADFNENNQVNLLDFSLMRPNFSQLGARKHSDTAEDEEGEASGPLASDSSNGGPTEAAAAAVAPTPQVQMALAIPSGDINAGDRFSVEIQVRAGTQEVDGAAAYLDYDPSVLKVVGLTPGNALSTVLQNQTDTPGQINFAAGTFANFPTGTFALARVEFEALAEATGNRIDLVRDSGRESDATFAGESVLSCVFGATLGFGTDELGVIEGAPAPTPKATPSASPTPDDGLQSGGGALSSGEPAASSGGGCQMTETRHGAFGLWLLLGAALFMAVRRAAAVRAGVRPPPGPLLGKEGGGRR